MKWLAAQTSDTRVCRRFLLLPKTINSETRWMEWASWAERDYNRPDYFGWKPMGWVSA